jgi:hypothetical protein
MFTRNSKVAFPCGAWPVASVFYGHRPKAWAVGASCRNNTHTTTCTAIRTYTIGQRKKDTATDRRPPGWRPPGGRPTCGHDVDYGLQNVAVHLAARARWGPFPVTPAPPHHDPRRKLPCPSPGGRRCSWRYNPARPHGNALFLSGPADARDARHRPPAIMSMATSPLHPSSILTTPMPRPEPTPRPHTHGAAYNPAPLLLRTSRLHVHPAPPMPERLMTPVRMLPADACAPDGTCAYAPRRRLCS